MVAPRLPALVSSLGLAPEEVEPRPRARYVLVTATTPTPFDEGKT